MQGMLNCFSNTIDKGVINLALQVLNSTLLNTNSYFNFYELINQSIKWNKLGMENNYKCTGKPVLCNTFWQGILNFEFPNFLLFHLITRQYNCINVTLFFTIGMGKPLKRNTLGHFPQGSIFYICRTMTHSQPLLYHI